MGSRHGLNGMAAKTLLLSEIMRRSSSPYAVNLMTDEMEANWNVFRLVGLCIY
jgi:hypothetical protein